MTQVIAAAHRSYSQMNSLRSCAWAYKLERIDQKPQRPSAAAVAGRVIHVATEAIDHLIHTTLATPRRSLYAAGVRAAAETMPDEIRRNTAHYPVDQWKRYGRQDIAWFTETGIPRSIEAYIDWRLSSPWQLLVLPGFGPAIEVPFDLTLDGVIVRGYIDRIFKHVDDGQLLTVDLKSGKKPKTDEQLGTYNRALATAGLGLEFKWGAYLYGLKTGEATLTTPVDLTYYDDDRLRAIYGQADMMIRLGIFLPHPGEQCFFCSVTEHCDFFKSAI